MIAGVVELRRAGVADTNERGRADADTSNTGRVWDLIMGIDRRRLPLEGGPAHARETFRMIPDRLWLHHEVKDFDLRLWCSLLFLARGRDHCEATDAVLAKKIGCSVQTVQRGLARLEKAEFISREMDGRDRILRLHPEGDGQPLAEFDLRIA